jgi:hypothetical protein
MASLIESLVTASSRKFKISQLEQLVSSKLDSILLLTHVKSEVSRMRVFHAPDYPDDAPWQVSLRGLPFYIINIQKEEAAIYYEEMLHIFEVHVLGNQTREVPTSITGSQATAYQHYRLFSVDPKLKLNQNIWPFNFNTALKRDKLFARLKTVEANTSYCSALYDTLFIS